MVYSIIISSLILAMVVIWMVEKMMRQEPEELVEEEPMSLGISTKQVANDTSKFDEPVARLKETLIQKETWGDKRREKIRGELTPEKAYNMLTRRAYPTLLGDPFISIEEEEVFFFHGVEIDPKLVYDLADQYTDTMCEKSKPEKLKGRIVR